MTLVTQSVILLPNLKNSMKIQIAAMPGYVLGLAIIIGAAIACTSITKDQRVLVQNKTQLVCMVNGTNCIYPGHSMLIKTTNDMINVEASGVVKHDTWTNVWSGVELHKKLAPNTVKLEITLDDFP